MFKLGENFIQRRYQSFFALTTTRESAPETTLVQTVEELSARVRRKTLPKGLLGQAIDYALKRWEALTWFIADGILEVDNNLIENTIRPSALGKKNFLFFGHPEAGERSAVIYTLLGSCRRHGINPFDYLKDLFKRLPSANITQIRDFIPARWTATAAHQNPVPAGLKLLVGKKN